MIGGLRVSSAYAKRGLGTAALDLHLTAVTAVQGEGSITFFFHLY